MILFGGAFKAVAGGKSGNAVTWLKKKSSFKSRGPWKQK